MSQTKLQNNKRHVIIIFSKDRPDRLKKTLPNLRTTPYDVYLIDDSASLENQITIRRFCNEFCIKYHGTIEQEKVIKQLNANLLKKFVGRLGKKEWSLGHNRNYALIYGLLLGARKIIFMDDDVIVKPLLLEQVFKALSKIPFVGVQITLMSDHSVVGHIYREGGDILPQYVSGTFLGIDLKKVKHYFLNTYNEDWIWLFLENNGMKVPKISSVKQLKYDPFKNWESKIYFQEMGEILWDGLFYHSSPIMKSNLISSDYWDDILKIRMQEISSIANFNLPDHLKIAVNAIQKSLFGLHKTLSPDIFANQFKSYFELLDDWQSLLISLRGSIIANKEE